MISYRLYIVSYLSSDRILSNLKGYPHVKDYWSFNFICVMFLRNIKFLLQWVWYLKTGTINYKRGWFFKETPPVWNLIFRCMKQSEYAGRRISTCKHRWKVKDNRKYLSFTNDRFYNFFSLTSCIAITYGEILIKQIFQNYKFYRIRLSG